VSESDADRPGSASPPSDVPDVRIGFLGGDRSDEGDRYFDQPFM